MALVVGFVGFVVLDPPLGILALVGGLVIEVGELVFWVRFLRRYRVQTGAEGLLGERGVVLEDCRPLGTVRAHGEIWRAECPGGAVAGEEVVVVAVEGLTLRVEPQPR